MKKPLSLLLALSLVLALTACGSKNDGANTDGDAQNGENTESVDLIVFAAASMTETLNEIAEMYKEVAPNVNITYNFDSSGKLLTQISEGADCDLFISAAPMQMNAMDGSLIGDTEKNPNGLDLIVTDSRVDLLENKVITVQLQLDGSKQLPVWAILKHRRCQVLHGGLASRRVKDCSADHSQLMLLCRGDLAGTHALTPPSRSARVMSLVILRGLSGAGCALCTVGALSTKSLTAKTPVQPFSML